MKLAYLTSQFPETYETFIVREFAEVERQGVDFTIFSLKRCKDEIVHPEAVPFLQRTRSAGVFGLTTIWRNLAAAVGHPLVFWPLLFRIVLSDWSRPKVALKNLAGLALGVNLATLLRAAGYTHIHAHWMTVPATAALAASKLTGIPYSVTAHAWDIFTGDNLLKLKAHEARFVSTCSGFNQRYLNELLGPQGAGKVVLGYHGLQIPESPPREHGRADPVRIFSVGRLVEQKGFPYLFRALADLKQKGASFVCKIAGEGPLRASFEAEIARLGLVGQVVLLGAIPLNEIWKGYEECDMFVLPCVVTGTGDRDGIPNVVIEALSVRCPVLTTSISGIPELVENMVTGMTVPERDSAALADAILKLKDDPELRARLGENGRRRVEEMFDLEKNIRLFVNELRRTAT